MAGRIEETAIRKETESMTVKMISLLFSLAFLLAVPFAAVYTGETDILRDWARILFSPCPLVTDYYLLGSLPAAFLNAGMCGLACSLMFVCLDTGRFGSSNWAGYFLVVAHCFYGLNFVNMWPPVFGILIYCRVMNLRFRDTLDVAMFSTAFGPFVSELLFRYPFQFTWSFTLFGYETSVAGIISSILLGLFLGFAIPAMLPGAKLLHKGYNLYNGGLAFGLLGLLLYSFLYRTMGVAQPDPVVHMNTVYESHGNSYMLFCNLFFLIVFGICLVRGFFLNGRTFRGYGELLKDDSHKVDFFRKFGPARVYINLGFYGLFMLAYFDLVVLLTEGAGWTGATCGVTLAAVSFAASGQHPRNVLPVILGYVILYLAVKGLCLASGRTMVWSLSSQGYMNGLAFATGLCPFAGCYGFIVGIAAGFLSAVMCTTTSIMHGGFMLYNGGLTAGIAALILTPMLKLYFEKHNRETDDDEEQ